MSEPILGVNNRISSITTNTESTLLATMPMSPGQSRGLRFIGLDLNPGFTRMNVCAFYMLMFVGGLTTSFVNTFLSYIVKSPEYYDVKKTEAATVVGDLAFYSELSIVPCHILLGSLMDVTGRRAPTVIGLIGCAIAITCIPYGHTVYPDLCLMR